jgi:3-oxoacyl-[acyl-carrier-protein] synthase II
MKRAVITGMGVVTPLGNDPASLWSAMKEGKSGITHWHEMNDTSHKTKIAGTVRDFDPASAGTKEVRRMDRFCQFAVVAARQAWEDAGLHAWGGLDPERVGVYIGSGVGGISTFAANQNLLTARGPGRVSPTVVPMLIANMAAAQVSIMLGALGPSLAPVTACSIGNTAIGEAFKLIQRGGADLVAAGGTEAALTELALAGFGNAAALSRLNDEPSQASRPFAKDRDGFVMSEGAGIVIVEELDHALARGARIYAEIIGYGASSDAYHMVAPEPEGNGAYRAMKQAIADASLTPEDIDTISAHATGTELGDAAEAAAIRRLFGERSQSLPVTAGKSALGHMLGAAGGVQAVALVMSLAEGVIPPTLNQANPDDTIGLDVVSGKARSVPSMKIGLSNSFGFGGHNAVIVLRKYEDKQ